VVIRVVTSPQVQITTQITTSICGDSDFWRKTPQKTPHRVRNTTSTFISVGGSVFQSRVLLFDFLFQLVHHHCPIGSDRKDTRVWAFFVPQTQESIESASISGD